VQSDNATDPCCQGDRPFETEHMSDAASGSRVRIISLPSFWATGTIGRGR
jgi:hypothetical protein